MTSSAPLCSNPRAYGWVIVTGSALVTHCTLQGLYVAQIRRHILRLEALSKQQQTYNEAADGDEAPSAAASSEPFQPSHLPPSSRPPWVAIAREHFLAFGEGIDPEGYPDMGSGVYSSQLPYVDWFRLNCAIRMHSNYTENLPVVLVLLGWGGLRHPVMAAVFGVGYLLGRVCFGWSYLASPSKRKQLNGGGPLLALMQLGLLATSVLTAGELMTTKRQ
ncbi:unnamed protein product [Vitrella brassicaformis CCMP3155]|uniref:Glutathione transferase n=2 Tax=Vitrella brassicaformis TaxID=1169539 RepID=A0A0G4G688_VITBC|nr:unnamed protein product [Vitrella brassicaformis CCMP3155]|eukprot:CEM23767.1 unnamed protein product [Vitrella brassicaformis CCMP3155]